MELTHIDGSSNVIAAGYSEGVIRVLFRSGHWKDYPASAGDFEALMKAPSKGRFVHERFGAQITGPSVLAPLDTWQEDACCAPRLSRAIAAGQVGNVWECPKCGVGWRPDPVPGIGRHWKPQTWVSRF